MLSTFNGAETLPTVLEGYANTTQPEKSWSLVVINNGSTDEAGEILDSYKDKIPLSILNCPTPGKNKALNLGVDQVNPGPEFYIFTDDDAVPSKNFLIDWERGIAQFPDSTLFGATVKPFFKNPPPVWLEKFRRHFPELYAENVGGDRPIPAAGIFGPNMAVRASIIQNGLRFNEDIGPNSGQSAYPMGSETEFCERAAARNEARPRFFSSPCVDHIVRPRQMTPDFIKQRAFRHGRGTAMRLSLSDPSFGRRRRGARSHLLGLSWNVLEKFGVGRSWWEANWQKGFWDFAETHRKSR
jgi:glycosyltransferase involved in cell wall biosynthesis